jgi:hypothetical protein
MRYRKVVVAFALLSSLLFSRANAQIFGNNIPGTSITPGQAIGIVVGSAAAITVVTVVLVHNAHPTLKGCVTADPDGIHLHNEGDQKVYALTGITADVKVGAIVKIQGKKNKKQKDSAGNEEFMVTKISKDYGPCKAELAAMPSAAAPATAP